MFTPESPACLIRPLRPPAVPCAIGSGWVRVRAAAGVVRIEPSPWQWWANVAVGGAGAAVIAVGTVLVAHAGGLSDDWPRVVATLMLLPWLAAGPGLFATWRQRSAGPVLWFDLPADRRELPRVREVVTDPAGLVIEERGEGRATYAVLYLSATDRTGTPRDFPLWCGWSRDLRTAAVRFTEETGLPWAVSVGPERW